MLQKWRIIVIRSGTPRARRHQPDSAGILCIFMRPIRKSSSPFCVSVWMEKWTFLLQNILLRTASETSDIVHCPPEFLAPTSQASMATPSKGRQSCRMAAFRLHTFFHIKSMAKCSFTLIKSKLKIINEHNDEPLYLCSFFFLSPLSGVLLIRNFVGSRWWRFYICLCYHLPLTWVAICRTEYVYWNLFVFMLVLLRQFSRHCRGKRALLC